MYCSFLRNARYKDITIIKEDYTMPKMKTSRAAAKRFKAYKSHILTKKSTKRKRNLRKDIVTDATNSKVMKKILPYL